MAETDESKGDDTATDDSGGVELPAVIELLAKHDVHLPGDTTDGNFLHRLYVALTQATGGEDKDKDGIPDAIEESPGAVMMSADVKKKIDDRDTRIIHHERDGIVRRIKVLERTGRIKPPLRDKLLADAKTVQLSLDDAGSLLPCPLAMTVAAYEALDAGEPISRSARVGAVRLSADTDADDIEEVPPPTPADADTEARKFASERAARISRA